MREHMELGPTPCDEPCEQLGPNYNPAKARRESQVYANQLRRMFPDPPYGTTIGVKAFPHDFGSYIEVVVYFFCDDEESAEYAYKVESGLPANWDDEARAELKELSHAS